MADHSAWEFVGWLLLGFMIGTVVMFVEMKRIAKDKPPANRIESWLRRNWFPDLDKDTAVKMQAALSSLTRAVPKLESGQLVGKCGCGCGQDVHYNGRGRKPRFVNDWHKEKYQGKRVAIPTP